MQIISDLLVGLVALLHVIFLILEMFLWDKPIGLRVFGLSIDKARATKVLAANQGLYNGFLAAGLSWGLIQGAHGYDFKVFMLICVIIAGLYGAVSASKKILFLQAVPGSIALISVVLTY